MKYVGCDFHTRFQQISMLNTQTGEVVEKKIYHDGKEVEDFYGSLPDPTVVGIESTSYAIWFHELMEDLEIELQVGDAAKIRAQQVRKKKNDREDARLICQLMAQGRFPQVWMIDAQGRDLRLLLTRRHQWVKMRTAVKNALHSLALNHRLALRSSLFTRAGKEAFKKLKLRPYARQTAEQLWQQLDELNPRIQALDRIIEAEVRNRPQALLLKSHPGVGSLTALAWVLIIGPIERFASETQLVAYLGLVPTEHSSAGRRRFGHISKQGSRLMRHLLVEAGNRACRHESQLRRFYRRLKARRGMPIARVAVARKLAVYLYVMNRDGIDYTEFRQRRSSREACLPCPVTAP